MTAIHPTRSPLRQTLGLAGWLLLSFAAATAGGLASAQAGSFYRELVRPAWAPPGWLFGPVWTLLYLMMGVAAWRVWRDASGRSRRAALGLFIAQLIANALWTWIFFVWRQGGWAFAEILLLWAMILGTARLFAKHDKTAALLLLPYLAWVSFAAALTWSLWQSNPALLR